MFKISAFDFAKLQSFLLKKRKTNFKPGSCFGVFGIKFKKTAIAIIEIGSLEFIKSEFLTNTLNLGKGPSFSKGPSSTFSEDPDLGPAPLYKR